MNKSTRNRIDRAIEKGRKAFEEGQPISDCPYKIDSEWGVGRFWRMGYNQAKSEASRTKE